MVIRCSLDTCLANLLTIWVTNDLDNLCLPSASNLTVQTIEQIQPASNKLPPPTFISNAVCPKVCVVEWRKWLRRVTNETAGSVRVHTKQEWDEKMVGVPKGFERLLSNPVVSSGIDEKHAQQHDMSGNTTSFGIVDLQRNLRTHLGPLHVEKAAQVSFGRAQRLRVTYLT